MRSQSWFSAGRLGQQAQSLSVLLGLQASQPSVRPLQPGCLRACSCMHELQPAASEGTE